MEDFWKETFLLWSETEEYQRSITIAKSIIKEALSKYNNPSIAYSGGKDSLVLTHMVLQEKADTNVFHWDYGPYYMPRNLESEVIENVQKIGATNIIVRSSKKYDYMKRKKANIFYNDFFGNTIYELKSLGFDIELIGIREQESRKRKVKIHGNPFRENEVMMECYPLYKMSWRDIWSYIVSNKLPYCSHYDKYVPLVGYEQARFTTFFDPEFYYLGCSNIDGVLMTQFKNM